MITRPKPLPDELDRGYLGRVMRLNGFRNKNECLTQISAWAGLQLMRGRCVPPVMALARVAGMPSEDFTRRHTTVPFRRGVTWHLHDIMHGAESHETILRYSGMRLARSEAYFCRECAEADQAFHGMSYWRREHQIPGVFWCRKHGSPLDYVEDEWAFLEAPANLLGHCHSVERALADASAENWAVCRYVEICVGLLDQPKPIDTKDAAKMLSERAQELGLQTCGGKAVRPLLSHLVADSFDSSWLEEVFPGLVTSDLGLTLPQIDGVFQYPVAIGTLSYMLAACVLFDSVDEALFGLKSASSRGKMLLPA